MDIPRRILERRRAVRINETFLFKIGGKGYDFQAMTVNLSLHGVMGIVEQDIPLMSQLSIALELPSKSAKGKGASRALRIKGVVVRKEKDPRTGRYLIGIYFSNVKPTDQKRLETFITRYLKST